MTSSSWCSAMLLAFLYLNVLLSPTNAVFEDIINSFFGGGGGGGGSNQQHHQHHQHGHQQHIQQRGGGGGQERTRDARTTVSVTLNDLYLGAFRDVSYRRNVLCPLCSGTGAKDGATKRCSQCKGRGQIVVEQQVMPGFRMQTQKTCPKCGGKGQIFAHKCRHCRGHGLIEENTEIHVDIERGMRHGQEIRFRGKSAEMPGHKTGDLVVVLDLQKHAFFQREGNDLKTAVELSLTQALLGFDLNIQHLDERWVNLKHSEITHHKQKRLYPKEGMPVLKSAKKKGKLRIEYRVKFPKRINEQQRQQVIDLFPDLSTEGEYSV